MRKNHFILSAFLMFCGTAFSQTKPDAKESSNTRKETNTERVSNHVLNTTTPVERTALPSEQKPSPAVFYIIDDKPVDEQTYKNHQKQLLKK